MNRPLFIIGCGDFGREVFALAQALSTRSGPWDIAGFVDDKPSGLNRCLVSSLDSNYVGTVAELSSATGPFGAVVAIGSPATRVAIVEKLTSAPVTHPTLIHPSCTIGSAVTMGQGTIIADILQGLSIGDDCIVGAAACVVKAVPAGRTVMGVPAR